MNEAEQRAEDLRWIEDCAALEERLAAQCADNPNATLRHAATVKAGQRYRRIIGYMEERDRLETSLDYVASCYHMAMHGIKDAETWQECDRQPCRSANGRLHSVRRVGASVSEPA